MAFPNQILGSGGVLVRQHMQSEGFEVNEEAITGWRLEKEGAAYLTNVSVGGPMYQVDEDGNASFETVNANTSIMLAGEDLATLISDRGGGVVFVGLLEGSQTTATTGSGRSEWMNFIVPNVGERIYRVTIGPLYVNKGANNPPALQFFGNYDFDDPAADTDPLFLWDVKEFGTTTGDTLVDHITGYIVVGSADAGSDLNVALFYEAVAGVQIDPEPFGERVSYVVVEDVGPSDDLNVVDIDISGGGGGSAPTTYVNTYTATAIKAFRSNGSIHSTVEGAQGDGAPYSSNGNMQTAIEFDYSTIASDLAGSTILKVELYVYWDHWYYVAGGTAIYGTHNDTDVAGATSLSDISGIDDNRVAWGPLARNSGAFLEMPVSVGEDLRDSNARGIHLGPGPTADPDYYGKCHGPSEAHPPQLRITFEV